MSQDKTTHFGYQDVPWDDKEKRVKQVFDSVAEQYDLMNDLMSFGIHRLWKQISLIISGVKADSHILDLASGSGDLALGFRQKIGPKGLVILSDINEKMLNIGRNRMIDKGFLNNVQYVTANAESLPFKKNNFDIVSIGFGLRNVTNKPKALQSMAEVIKPGGKLMVLEFSKPKNQVLKAIYDQYSFSVLPSLGKWFADDEKSYRYLAESIRMHPGQDELKTMILDAGFDECHYHNLTGGIVALHTAYKY